MAAAVEPSRKRRRVASLPLASPPLATVSYGLLRAEPRLASLSHVADLLTELLDGSVTVSFVNAAASGSVRLFDRVAARVLSDAAVDAARRDFWLALAMEHALRRDDLPMVQRIHGVHPAPLYIYTTIREPEVFGSTLALAFQFGSLATVRWVVENRCDRQCCPPGVANLCRGCLLRVLPSIGEQDAFAVVTWLVEHNAVSIFDTLTLHCLSRAMQSSTELVHFMNDRAVLGQATLVVLLQEAIKQRRTENALALLDLLEPSAQHEDAILLCLVWAVSLELDEVVVQLMVQGHCNDFKNRFVWASVTPGGRKILQWDKAFLTRMTSHTSLADVCSEVASACGDLDALQWLYYERRIFPTVFSILRELDDQERVLLVYKWMVAVGIDLPSLVMDAAATKGFLHVLKWLHEYAAVGCTRAAMDGAAANGHLDVVQWIDRHRNDGDSGDAMTAAAGGGQLHVVQWLYATRPQSYLPEAIRRAADSNQLDVLQWLADCTTSEMCTECVTRAVLRGRPMAFDCPRSVDVLNWVRCRSLVLCALCERLERDGSSSRAGALVEAVGNGDLELAEFLYRNYRHKLQFANPSRAVRRVAHEGHLRMLQWVHANLLHTESQDGNDSFFPPWDGDWRAASQVAAQFGHHEIVKWIADVAATVVLEPRCGDYM